MNRANNILSQKFFTNNRILRYSTINSVFFTDTLLAKKTPSTIVNKYAQLYVSHKGLVMIYPMKSQSLLNHTLRCFCKEIVVPVSLVMEGHMFQKNNKTEKSCHQFGTTLRILEVVTPLSNLTELYIGLFKEYVCRDLHMTNSPMVLWYYWM